MAKRTFYNPYERNPVNVETQIGGTNKVIKDFVLDLSDLGASGEKREFTITCNKDSEFILEIKNEDSYYYNFRKDAFQADQARLEKNIENIS